MYMYISTQSNLTKAKLASSVSTILRYIKDAGTMISAMTKPKSINKCNVYNATR